jgi:tRNA-Thr(GGU) m(6)t(6)A37 methyltransferase TsaA
MCIPQLLFSMLLTTASFQGDQAKTPLFNQSTIQEPMSFEYHPIGEFITDLTPETGAPRQGALTPENKGIIRIHSEYTEALRDLESCSHIIVLYHMHLSTGWNALVRPPGSGREMGLFATRSPNRPNSIGFSVIKLDRVEGQDIHVSGVDAFNGTPVLDIKPWIPSLDCPDGGDGSAIEKKVGLVR